MKSKATAIRDLKTAIVAIVSIRHKCPMPRDIPYQVTLDPAELSPLKNHISVGRHPGDELRGWIATDDIEIREVLREYKEGEKTPRQAKPRTVRRDQERHRVAA